MSEERVPYYTGPRQPPPRQTPSGKRTAKPRKKAKPKSVRYGPGRYTPAPNGRGYDCSVSSGGIRHRARMPDEAAARAWIDATEASAAADLPALTRAQLIDARHALSLLPEGTTLTAAARAWLGTSATASGEPLASCAQRYLETRRDALRPATAASYRQFLDRLMRAIPSQTAIDAIGPREIEHALTATDSHGHNRNNALRAWSAFFSWAIRQGLASTNPCAGIHRDRLPEPPKGILTPPQAAALLRAAERHDPRLIPYLSLGLFAGIRAAELMRLSAIHIGPEYIRLDGSVTKTADARTVPVAPNLASWLKAHPLEPGAPVAPLTKKRLNLALQRIRFQTLSETDPAARIKTWPANCMRHSNATYRYEQTHDAALVASEMGHRGTDIFFRHYRALALPGDGAKYFAILPTKSQRQS
ncbi:MAG TPA: tyrosine-type recombinase/integrase [Kiritimatiellia bacterium]|nr:tyrosine-type recombinase/integrase [Kiritimatiellia bacterium]HRU70185.1 tyrosine-type recombinase/integrase [Kiritimatiellia bacterium]